MYVREKIECGRHPTKVFPYWLCPRDWTQSASHCVAFYLWVISLLREEISAKHNPTGGRLGQSLTFDSWRQQMWRRREIVSRDLLTTLVARRDSVSSRSTLKAIMALGMIVVNNVCFLQFSSPFFYQNCFVILLLFPLLIYFRRSF